VMRRPCLLSLVVLSRKAGVGDVRGMEDGGWMEDGLMARWIIVHSQTDRPVPWADRRVPFFRPLRPRHLCYSSMFFGSCSCPVLYYMHTRLIFVRFEVHIS
jgi:hypothetical protein